MLLNYLWIFFCCNSTCARVSSFNGAIVSRIRNMSIISQVHECDRDCASEYEIGCRYQNMEEKLSNSYESTNF